MVHLPVRKCVYLVKVGSLIALALSVLALFEVWRGARRSANGESAPGARDEEQEYERQVREDEARLIPGLGEGGAAARLVGEDQRLGEESEKKLAINVHLSDRIPYNRTLKDYRNPACARVLYDAELPSASVVIIFHNEPYSVVLRTVWSVLSSARRDQPWYRRANFVERGTGRRMTLGYPGQDPASPFVYLKEIILVDDNSTLPELKGKLSHYVRTRLPPDVIRILRLPERVGLTRARLAGARYAAGDALVFLDAHCEPLPDWLRPLLARVKEAPHAVVMPIIDVIEAADFYYSVQDAQAFQGLMRARSRGARAATGAALVFLDAHCEAGADWLRPLLARLQEKRDAVVTPLIDVLDQRTLRLDAAAAERFQVGGFTFVGHFTWIDVPEREKKRRGSDIAPTWSPTMAGGLFAINRLYYWELGAYDEQMAGWGGENLEMSFRIWQCGGTLETVPCSRVGHVFRSFHPYGLPAQADTHGINTARMAEVWMDEYAELFYLHRPDLRNNPKVGDVTHRRVLRDKLHCKSFQWYLDTVYKEKFVPVRDAVGYGRFRNAASGLCLDTLQREGEASPLGVYPCHAALQGTQYLTLSLGGQLRDEEKCAELQYSRADGDGEASQRGRRLLMVTCRDTSANTKWRYLPTRQLQHVQSGLCVDAGWESGADVLARRCRPAAPAQLWDIDYTEDNGFRLAGAGAPSDQELRLQQLRGHRSGRISRSLLSHSEENSEPATTAAAGMRRRQHRKRRYKKAKRHGKARSGKSKNKFILKLVRAAPGAVPAASEEHLEVDIHCRHRRLYPNDSFVRDLVTILNERNIKVVNNGRVFERNKVTELGRSPVVAHVLHTLDVPPAAPAVKRWRSKKRKRGRARSAHRPLEPSTLIEPLQPAPAALATPAGDKKIIIEDFVERPGKRQRTHAAVATESPMAPLDTADAGGEGAVLMSLLSQKRQREGVPVTGEPSSAETPPPADSAPERGVAPDEPEDWPLGEARFRSNDTSRRDLEREDNELGPREDARPPLKVVMRSNLTFNLGDGFFKWRSGDDVAELLGELAIPSSPSRSPPPPAAPAALPDDSSSSSSESGSAEP